MRTSTYMSSKGSVLSALPSGFIKSHTHATHVLSAVRHYLRSSIESYHEICFRPLSPPTPGRSVTHRGEGVVSGVPPCYPLVRRQGYFISRAFSPRRPEEVRVEPRAPPGLQGLGSAMDVLFDTKAR